MLFDFAPKPPIHIQFKIVLLLTVCIDKKNYLYKRRGNECDSALLYFGFQLASSICTELVV